jgi:diguanylate cyclase (GGDEF)-like protein
VDHFKRYNDAHGHVAGDDALRKVAHTLGEVFRESDRVYRYGGEEFVIVFPEQSAGEASAAVERARAAVEASCDVTLSAGVAHLAEGADVRGWLEAADAALYRAKSAGRNRVVAA